MSSPVHDPKMHIQHSFKDQLWPITGSICLVTEHRENEQPNKAILGRLLSPIVSYGIIISKKI
jgi:hypothetical protein